MSLSNISSIYRNLFISPANLRSKAGTVALKIFSTPRAVFPANLKGRIFLFILGAGVLLTIFFRYFRKPTPPPSKAGSAAVDTSISPMTRREINRPYVWVVVQDFQKNASRLANNNVQTAGLLRAAQTLSELSSCTIQARETALKLFEDVKRKFYWIEKIENRTPILGPSEHLIRLYFMRAGIAKCAVEMSDKIVQNPIQKDECLQELAKMKEALKPIKTIVLGMDPGKLRNATLTLLSRTQRELQHIEAFLIFLAEKVTNLKSCSPVPSR